MSQTENPAVEELQERFRESSSEELRGMLTPMQRMNMTDEALDAIRLVLAERGEPTESPVAPRCPQCAAPLDLEAGYLVMEERWLAQLLEWIAPYLPFSIAPVTRYVPDDGGKKRIVLTEYRSRRAGRCRHCGLIIFSCPAGESR